jgi:hypothetical protein
MAIGLLIVMAVENLELKINSSLIGNMKTVKAI